MLDPQIERDRKWAEQAILSHYRNLYLPYTVLAPSARFGLYATAKALLSPGDRVLISPITCRSVIHALLAAGVTPVFVDIEPTTGNIDVSRLANTELSKARAIVTTNLYGNPDAVFALKQAARSHGLLLVEDCAHVLHTTVESQEIGGAGDISVFSFKKYFDELGGVICARNEAAARKIAAIIDSEAALHAPREERLRYWQFRLTKATGPALVRKLSSIYRGVRGTAANQSTASVAIGLSEASAALMYSLPTTASLMRVAGLVQRWQELIAEKLGACRRLIAECPLPLKNCRSADEVIYLAVPFSCPDRDGIVSKLRSRGVPTYFLYTPPMSTVFRTCAQSIPGFDHERIADWCRTTLPIMPKYGQELLAVLRPETAGVEDASRRGATEERPWTLADR